MRHTLLVVPTGHGVGLTSASLALVRAFDRQGIDVGFCKPIAQQSAGDTGPERSTTLLSLASALRPPEPLNRDRVEELLASGDDQGLMEEVVARCQAVLDSAEVVIVEGMVPSIDQTYSMRVNQALARTLDAEVILVGNPGERPPAEVAESMSIAARLYRDGEIERITGCILNRVMGDAQRHQDLKDALAARHLPLISLLPHIETLNRIRIADLVRQLDPEIINRGNLGRRIIRISVLGRSIPGVLKALKPGTLLITPGDRHDIIIAVCLAALNGVRLAGLLITACDLDPAVAELTAAAKATGLPILAVKSDTFETTSRVHNLDREIAADDRDRAELMMNSLADHLDQSWIQGFATRSRSRRLSPPAFRYGLIQRSRKADKRIVLPEGEEPRTIRAAVHCCQRNIARCVLLGNPGEIARQITSMGLVRPTNLEIIDPRSISEGYIEPLVALRKAKGLTPEIAREELSDAIVVGTMMLKLGHVDGLVSGAVHTTAHTIRPALQVIKTAPGCALVSSVFFMCLPDQVVVYGDCAVNPDPTAEQLADIALQSAASAVAFGIEPRVAMISYSTGTSGTGADVDKVREATRLARAKRPDLAIDGPLQYDAAVMASVGRSKLPGSAVAGQATVFVFPDLNTGNTVYKAVQRSANVVSIGPMLQGLAKPVNDLSRGALVEDIIYTIALTAIQAANA